MSFPSILSIGASALAALLSLIMFFRGGANLTLQTELQKRTQDVQTQQQELQLQQQQLQAQQETVNSTKQLAETLGPQIIGNLKVAGMRTNNANIFALLAKHKVEITDAEKEQIKKLLKDEAAKKAEGGDKKPDAGAAVPPLR